MQHGTGLSRDAIAGHAWGRERLRPARLAIAALAVAVGVLAWVLAHRLAYLVAGEPHHAEDGASHGYLPVVSVAAALTAAVALVAIARSWRRHARGRPRGIAADWVVPSLCWALLPAALFLPVELAERSFAAVPSGELLVAGVALQVAVAGVALLLFRIALRAVLALAGRGRLLSGGATAGAVRRVRRALRLRPSPLASAAAGRAPPLG